MNNEARMNWIQDQLVGTLHPSVLKIQDDSYKHAKHEGAKGGAGHFTIEIWSDLFEQKSLIECHRMIYQILETAIPQEIHALKIKIIKP